MLREFGVKGVKVQEVVSLDEEMMAFLEYEHPPTKSLKRLLLKDGTDRRL